MRHSFLIRSGTNSKSEKLPTKTIQYLPVSVRVEGKRIALAELIVGPNQDAENARQRLKELLADNGYSAETPEYPKITEQDSAAFCAANGLAGDGWYRKTHNIIVDQFGGDVKRGGISLTEILTIGAKDDLRLGRMSLRRRQRLLVAVSSMITWRVVHCCARPTPGRRTSLKWCSTV